MSTLVDAGRLIKERRHGVPLTVNTNGLLGSTGAEQLFNMDVYVNLSSLPIHPQMF